MTAANTADQHAMAAGQSADAANKNAQEAYNRVDSLSGVVANLDNYTPLADVNVTFAFDKSVLTDADKEQLDNLATTLQTARGYILALTGGTDTTATPTTTISLASAARMRLRTICRRSTTFRRTSSTSLVSVRTSRWRMTIPARVVLRIAELRSSCSPIVARTQMVPLLQLANQTVSRDNAS